VLDLDYPIKVTNCIVNKSKKGKIDSLLVDLIKIFWKQQLKILSCGVCISVYLERST